ncbi:MAG: hypothetical protein AAFQ66_20495 [Pseudomonadota bacterium]
MGGASNREDELEQLVLLTSNPYDLIPRVFDFARKASIVLDSLETVPQSNSLYEVRFAFRSGDPTDLQTLAKRAALIQSGMDRK